MALSVTEIIVNVSLAGLYLEVFVCGGKLCTPSQGSPVYTERNSPADSNDTLEKNIFRFPAMYGPAMTRIYLVALTNSYNLINSNKDD